MQCTDNISEQQRDRFFMVLALIGLRRPDFDSVRDQIITSPVVPTLEDVSAKFLRISLNKNNFSRIESSVLAAQSGNQPRQGTYQSGKGKRLHCTYGDKSNYSRDTCWPLHGQPSCLIQSNNVGRSIAHMAQFGENGILPLHDGKDQVSDSILLNGADYKEYLQYQTAK
ncbi:uncharacterized protein LOC131179934 [Hevea brasiliensis]|uniref:uncharacterized protein LOC131179934 n=1 Tax=Hevea brasiliensis TaxID=3981 RepID=UPI0025DA9559|nr:uncharacterized protein LOC131179934 [Hevea brasiliensis]